MREAAGRVIGLYPYDVQVMGGIVLHQGKIAEMKTGEGKTLVATMPACLNGLTGNGVHIVTVNDYLARRDCEWMGPVLSWLGLTVGVILHDMDPPTRRAAYSCDVTYGTNNEFGFDYLRDNMAPSMDTLVQRGHNYAIVDEVDSILIDEARTPLIISGQAEESTESTPSSPGWPRASCLSRTSPWMRKPRPSPSPSRAWTRWSGGSTSRTFTMRRTSSSTTMSTPRSRREC